MPETSPLAVGAPYYCSRCHTPHVTEQPYADRSTAQRTHLYITCRGEHYYVGQLAVERPEPTRMTEQRTEARRCPNCNLGQLKPIDPADVTVTKADHVDLRDAQGRWQCDRCGYIQIGTLKHDV